MSEQHMTGRDIVALALLDPGEYERLLHSYTLLLGERKLWWERVAEAESKGWKAAVRSAISFVANQTGVPARMFADWLDLADLPKTRALVLSIARDRLRSRA